MNDGGKRSKFFDKEKAGQDDTAQLVKCLAWRMKSAATLHHTAQAAVVMAVAACTGCFLFRKIGDEGFGGEE